MSSSLLKKMLPTKVIVLIQSILAGLTKTKEKIAFLSSNTMFLSTAFYFILSRSFDREHYSVLHGKKRYFDDIKHGKAGLTLLRRNIHRLEKGLIMKPRRPIFAKDYIGATVDFLDKVIRDNPDTEKDELDWFCDVLNSYFIAVSTDPVIDKAREKFRVTLEHREAAITNKMPYVRDFTSDLPSFEQFKRLSHRRRSVRWFEDREVPRSLIDDAILVASQSPTACNRQPYRFHIFDEPDLVKDVSSIPGGTAGFNHNFPVFIAVIGQLRAYFDERDRHVIYIDASLASMSFLFALETLGLSSCAINWPDVPEREKRMSNALKLDEDERVVMCIAVGFPDQQEKVPYSQKKSLHQLRKYN